MSAPLWQGRDGALTHPEVIERTHVVALDAQGRPDGLVVTSECVT